jgi:hypothetical protein
MANTHFAEIGDVWKHLPLAEVLAIERPGRYWETHAGSALYPLTPSPRRDYGAYRLLAHANQAAALQRSTYVQPLEPTAAGLSPVQLWAELAGQGVRAMLWYGFLTVADQAGIAAALDRRVVDPGAVPLWAGEILVAGFGWREGNAGIWKIGGTTCRYRWNVLYGQRNELRMWGMPPRRGARPHRADGRPITAGARPGIGPAGRGDGGSPPRPEPRPA